ncbi:penicillin-binding protein 1C [Comamonadaceae bacterium PP-2]
MAQILRAMCCTATLCAASGLAWALPSFDDVRAAYPSSETLVLDRHGELLQRLRTDYTVRRGEWVSLEDTSGALRLALVLSEDRRFYAHSGVDWASVSAAAWGHLFHERTRGASTISMQLVGLLGEGDRPRSGQRTVLDKVGQVVSGTVLDRRWRKDRVLEAYLNLVPWRGELVGIDALSRTLFGKAAHGLDDGEAAIAAALVRAPNAPVAQVARRACGVWRDMRQARAQSAPVTQPDCLWLTMLTQSALERSAYASSAGIAPHAARQALRAARPAPKGQQPPLLTTLDARLQRVAQESLGRHLRELRGREVNDGALVVLDNASGDVLAYVGSSGELSQAREVDAAMAPRQPGSTLKPLLYAQALAERRLTAASLLHDAPTHIDTSGGLYIPQNYDRDFKGWVSVRTALAASLNVPAVRTLAMVTPAAFARQLRDFGLTLPQTGDYYGFSLALGSAEVSLLALTNAYRTLANGGHHGNVRFLPGPTPAPGPVVIDPRAAYVVADILSDPNARARTFGTRSVLATRTWTAVKTGTSKDMRDNWVVGWSHRYTVGVWVGNAEGQSMRDISGTSGAAPVWADLMQALESGMRPDPAPAVPAGLVRQSVRFSPDPPGESGRTALEATRSEWFLSGTEQTVSTRLASRAAPSDPVGSRSGTRMAALPEPMRITSPVSGTVIALDPDIPPTHQRLTFKAQGVDVRWELDGQPLGRGPRLAWLPWPGRHQVRVVDARGTVHDEIRIEVRGAGLSQPMGQDRRVSCTKCLPLGTQSPSNP